MLIDLLIEAVKAIIVVVMVLNLAGVLLWFERKGSALIQDRIGANRASITGLGKRMGLPNLGMVNTADRRSDETVHQGRLRARRRRQVPARARAVSRAVPGA